MPAGCPVLGCAGAVFRPQSGCRCTGYRSEGLAIQGAGQLADASPQALWLRVIAELGSCPMAAS
eukprot:5030982-Heterocapsa_arctica.AAC.1